MTTEFHVLSPRKNVAALGTPLVPRQVIGTVPEARLLAFREVSELPIPLKDAPVIGPETISDVPIVAVP